MFNYIDRQNLVYMDRQVTTFLKGVIKGEYPSITDTISLRRGNFCYVSYDSIIDEIDPFGEKINLVRKVIDKILLTLKLEVIVISVEEIKGSKRMKEIILFTNDKLYKKIKAIRDLEKEEDIESIIKCAIKKIVFLNRSETPIKFNFKTGKNKVYYDYVWKLIQNDDDFPPVERNDLLLDKVIDEIDQFDKGQDSTGEAYFLFS